MQVSHASAKRGALAGSGWLLGRQRELIVQFARLTPQRWILAAVGIAAIQYLGRFQTDPGHPYYNALHATYVLGYALTMWSLVFLSIGIFKKFFSRPHPVVRYIADSSYWLYLVHLPIVESRLRKLEAGG